MSQNDLTSLLRAWPFESGEILVRLIEAEDGRPLIQMRVDLGILQMEVTGRPDGQRIDGHETVLDAFVAKLAEHEAHEGHGDSESEDAAGGSFSIGEAEARRLREEVIQFYHRYVSFFALDEFEGVIRDADHNLAIIDFCCRYGETEFDQQVMEQLRPNTLMMRARAQASQAIAAKDTKAALAAIEAGLEQIREAMDRMGEGEEFEESSEVQILRSMREALVPKLPASQRVELQDRLKAALAAENYELAAILRDEIRMLKD